MTSEPLDCGLDRGLCVGVACDVELDGEEVVGLADGVRHRVGVAPGRDHSIPGREGRLGDVHAHAAPGTGDEPDLLVGHRDLSLMGWVGRHVRMPSNHPSFPSGRHALSGYR